MYWRYMIHLPQEKIIVRFGDMELSANAGTLMLNYLAALSGDEAPSLAPAMPQLPRIGSEFQGGIYAGIARGKDGAPDYHLILLPEAKEDINWDDAMKWAAGIGGDLPTRSEQSLLFANLKDQFEERYYWSNTQHADGGGYAWGQNFDYGYQGYNRKSGYSRARAVRRLVI